MIVLLGPVVAAVIYAGRRDLTGPLLAKPFAVAGMASFVVAGILLFATLMAAGEMAVNLVLLGTAAFGSAVICGTVAIIVWLREQRRVARLRNQRPWPHSEDL